MDGIKQTKEIITVPKVETPLQYQQPMFQIPPAWNSISYGMINLQSNVEDMGALMGWLKYMIDMEKSRRPAYLG